MSDPVNRQHLCVAMEKFGLFLEQEIAKLPPPKPKREKMDRPALMRFHANKRRAAKIERTPPWADLKAMRGIYAEAHRLSQETGVPHHVDHEFPLQGRLVSGLHVHNNLQILTGSENSKKRNRFEVET